MSDPARQTVSLDEIKDLLLASCDAVVYRYAPPAKGSHEVRGRYFTLNPGRADRSVGSFCVQMHGPRAGRWNDYATGEHGDIIDLIALSLGCSLSDAVREARAYLGLQSASPADLRRRQEAAARARAQRAAAARHEAQRRARRARAARALWLSGQAGLRGTPVEAYLRDRRGIDLAAIGRQPASLRYLHACRYEHTDPETGEVISGSWPAMLACVVGAKGAIIACHRTWLAIAPDGRWDKAPVPKAKKVLGRFAGGWIPIWTGKGPRGGKGKALSDAPPGSTLYVTEGIEDALSVVALAPDLRVVAGISLSNLGSLELPQSIGRVVLVADQDESPDARKALERAQEQHRKAGRAVALWQNRWGGKDINDALRAAEAGAAG